MMLTKMVRVKAAMGKTVEVADPSVIARQCSDGVRNLGFSARGTAHLRRYSNGDVFQLEAGEAEQLERLGFIRILGG
jgi:hypothetical protein